MRKKKGDKPPGIKMDPFCPIDSLANEILVQIFEEVYHCNSLRGHQNLFPCLLVSRRWHAISLPLLWKSLQLVDSNGTPSATAQSVVETQDSFLRWPSLNTKSTSNVLLNRIYESVKVQGLSKSGMHATSLCFVRRLSISITPFDKYEDNDRLVKVVTACNFLQSVDVSFNLYFIDAVSVKLAWVQLSQHFSRMDLETLRLRVEMASLRPWMSPQLFLNIDGDFLLPILALVSTQLTHLTIEQTNADIEYFKPLFIPIFRRLKVLTLLLKVGNIEHWLGPKPLSDEGTTQFWKSFQGTELQELVLSDTWPLLSWNNGFVVFPPTLRKLVITLPSISRYRRFNPIIIFKQLANLETLIIRTSTPSSDQYQREEINLVQHETISCHELQKLHIQIAFPQHLLENVIPQCPRLRDIALPYTTTDGDLLILASYCKHLTRLEISMFPSRVTGDGLRYLCHCKSLSWICLSGMMMTALADGDVLGTWARELPSLRNVVLRRCWLVDVEINQVGNENFWEEEAYEMERWMSQYERKDWEEGVRIDMEAIRRDLLEWKSM